MDATKTITSIFLILAFFAVLSMMLKNPGGSNALIGAGADTIAGLTKTLEGRGTGSN